MKWNALAASTLLWLGGPALAVQAAWQTDDSVGVNQVVYTLSLSCPNPGLVCGLIDGYVDQETSLMSGTGTLDLDDDADRFRFEIDSTQDVGSGPQPAYGTLRGSDVSFANIPFAGVPEITDLLVFGLTDPNLPAVGLDLLAPGDYPFSQTVVYSGSGLVVGDLEFLLGPVILVPPDDVTLSGTLRVLGDLDLDGDADLELRDVTGTFAFQNLTTIGGESVSVDVTADMTLNLSTPVAHAAVPALGAPAAGILAGLLAAVGIVLLVRARH